MLFSCQSAKKESTTTTSLQSIKLGVMPSVDYLPFAVAKNEGIYDSLGLDVAIVNFFSANDRDAAFQSGAIDGTIIDYTGALLQAANGIPLKLVMQNDGLFYFIASKESNLKTLNQIKGKNVAVSRNTVIEFATDQFIKKVGITPDEINKPEINKIPLRLEMLQNNQIDAAVFPDPFATLAQMNGLPLLATSKDIELSVTGTMFTHNAISRKEEEIKVLLKGYNLAIEKMEGWTPNTLQTFLQKELGVTKEQAERIKTPSYKPATAPTKETLMQVILWLKRKKLIPQEYTGETIVASEFTEN